MKYQLIVLGPRADQSAGLVTAVQNRLGVLGLNPATDLEIVSEETADKIAWKGVPVAVWYGGSDTSASELLNTLLHESVPVLPLVEDVAHYTSLVPDVLHPINGRNWDDDRVPADVLRLFRLTRELRQVFVSYRRTDSSPVAAALYDALSHRGYHVFLDTASVEAAVRFQDILWDRLADMDLLLLLDSPNCLTSRWVLEELTRVNHLGLGVLQLVWPGREPYPGTELSTVHLLDKQDFTNGDDGPNGTLTAAALATITGLAETVRIRSLGARRRRVVDEVVDRMSGKKLQVGIQPAGPLTIYRNQEPASQERSLLGVVLPVVGLPSARSIHQLENDLRRLKEDELWAEGLRSLDQLIDQHQVRILYDGLGIEGRHSEYLLWLNQQLKLWTIHFDRHRGESFDPLERWLRELQEQEAS